MQHYMIQCDGCDRIGWDVAVCNSDTIIIYLLFYLSFFLFSSSYPLLLFPSPHLSLSPFLLHYPCFLGSFSAEDVTLWGSFLDELSVLQIVNITALPQKERAVFFLNLYHVMVNALPFLGLPLLALPCLALPSYL
jgi:hypothetical protein